MDTKAIVAGLICGLWLTGCETAPSKTVQGAAAGTALGAGAGAIIGHQTGRAGEGAAIGAGLGAIGGGLMGSAQQQYPPAAGGAKFCPVGGETYAAEFKYCPIHGAELRNRER